MWIVDVVVVLIYMYRFFFPYRCMGMMANDACPSASALAAVNGEQNSTYVCSPIFRPDLYFLWGVVGVIQVSTVLPQAIAPAFATSLFAYSIKSDLAGGNLVWVICVAISIYYSPHPLRLSPLMSFSCGPSIACSGAIHSLFLNEPTADWRMERDT